MRLEIARRCQLQRKSDTGQARQNQQPASTEAPLRRAHSEAGSEVQISQPTPPVAGDAEVMAAIASLAPTNGHSEAVPTERVMQFRLQPTVLRSLRSSKRPALDCGSRLKLGWTRRNSRWTRRWIRFTRPVPRLKRRASPPRRGCESSAVAVAEPVEPAMRLRRRNVESATASNCHASRRGFESRS